MESQSNTIPSLTEDSSQNSHQGHVSTCEKFQTLDGLQRYERGRSDPISLEQLRRTKDCMVCVSIANVVETYLKALERPELQAWPQSQLDVCNQGPYFLDQGAYNRELEQYRVDFSDPECLKARLILSLEVSVIQGPENTGGGNKRVQEQHTVTPQFCLTYSTGKSQQLISMEPWEVPLFDPSLLMKWVHGCERLHENTCGNVQQQSGE